MGIPPIARPPYSPELNPAERLFEEVRRVGEGVVYGDLTGKMAAVERHLQALAADPACVQRLVAWPWIQQVLADLPPPL